MDFLFTGFAMERCDWYLARVAGRLGKTGGIAGVGEVAESLLVEGSKLLYALRFLLVHVGLIFQFARCLYGPRRFCGRVGVLLVHIGLIFQFSGGLRGEGFGFCVVAGGGNGVWGRD